VASSDRSMAAVEQQARELDVLAEVTRRFIDVVAAQERVSLARETSNLTERTAS
jgi:outer membrane protein, heavy metal efflux system